jgi:hypothetical protein
VKPAAGNPLGVRGADEGGISAAAAALPSAVKDALGLVGGVGRLPLTAVRAQALAAHSSLIIEHMPTTEGTRCYQPQSTMARKP